jgi:putative ABC transport system permease protein
MSSFLLIFSYVSFERSYDAFNQKADRINRVICDTKTQTEVLPTGMTSGPTGAAVLITFLTVGFHSIKAAVADPVDSLRTE